MNRRFAWWRHFTTETRMLCQNSLLFRFFFSPGNKETVVAICLTIEATQSSLVFVANDAIMHIAYWKMYVTWLNANKLTINAKKSNFVIFRPMQKKLTYQICLKIQDNNINAVTALENKDYITFLGVLISQYQKYHNTLCLSLQNFA